MKPNDIADEFDRLLAFQGNANREAIQVDVALLKAAAQALKTSAAAHDQADDADRLASKPRGEYRTR